LLVIRNKTDTIWRAIEVHFQQPQEGGLYDEAIMGRYMNHARDPNLDCLGVGVATRDIQACEELPCDYRDFMADVSHIDYLRTAAGE
jgi:hypothetical protein